MIVRAGLGIESGALFVQEDGADLTLFDETVKVAIHGAETDPRQLFVNPSVDLVDERVRMIALDSCEHLLKLTCSTLAGSPPHRLPRILALGRSDVSGCGLSNQEFAVKRFPRRSGLQPPEPRRRPGRTRHVSSRRGPSRGQWAISSTSQACPAPGVGDWP